MSILNFLARLVVFVALSALSRHAPDPALREMLFAVLVVFSLRVLFAPNRAYHRCVCAQSPAIPSER